MASDERTSVVAGRAIQLEFHREERLPRDSTGERGHGLDGTIELPAGTAASVSLRVSGAAAVITLNGKTEKTLWNADIGGGEVEIRGRNLFRARRLCRTRKRRQRG